MSSTMWHYIWQNQQVGPIPEGELRRFLAEGRLPADTLVWTAGMAQWAPAFQVAPFQPGSQTPTPAPAPVVQQVAAAAQPDAPATALAPSEVVFFHAERFAPAGGMFNGMETITGQNLKPVELGQAILATAFLAAEQAGAIAFTITEKKGLFGLKTNKILEVVPGPNAGNWSPDTLEAAIAMMARQGVRGVSDMVYALLLHDSSVPATLPYGVVRVSLVRKGLLFEQQQKGMLGAISYTYSLSDQARQLAGSHDPNPLLHLLGETQRTRLDLWQALAAGISSGFSRRKEIDHDRDHSYDND